MHAHKTHTHTRSLSLSRISFWSQLISFWSRLWFFFFFYRAEFEDIYYGTIKKCWCFVDWKKLMVVIGLHTYLQVYIGRVSHSVVSLWDPMEPTRLLRSWDFSGHMQINPWWLSDKRICLYCRRHRRREFDPWIEKIPWRKRWEPSPVFLSGKLRGQRNLAGYSP